MRTTTRTTTRTTAIAGPTTAGPTTDVGTMRAVTQDRYGAPDVLEIRRVDRPAIAPTEVLIEVHAAGVDRGVWHLVTGQPYLIRLAGYGLTKPNNTVPGLDVAGSVVAVGDEVVRFAPGDEVFGIANGSYAEYAAASQDKLAHRPFGVPVEHAAVASISGITALQALTDVGGLQSGRRVLVVGASGGVGTYAVQLAKVLGGEVTGVCSTSKVAMVRELGADHVIDYTVDDFADGAIRYDLILDIGGRSRIRRLRRALSPTGTLVIVGGENGGRWTGGIGRQLRAMALSPFVRQRLTTFVSAEHHSSIETLAGHLASGAVLPAIGKRFGLDGVADALREMEAGHTRGKSVIIVRDDVSSR